MAHKKYLSQMRSASSLKGRFQCEKPYSAPFCRDFHKGRLRCAGHKKLLIICDSVTEKAKYGKMRQDEAVNGSQMVVKTEGFLLPWGEGESKRKMKSDQLFCLITYNQFNGHTYNNDRDKQN